MNTPTLLQIVDRIMLLRSVLNVLQTACNNQMEINPEDVSATLAFLDIYFFEPLLNDIQMMVQEDKA